MLLPTLEVGEQRGTGQPRDAPNHQGWGWIQESDKKSY